MKETVICCVDAKGSLLLFVTIRNLRFIQLKIKANKSDVIWTTKPANSLRSQSSCVQLS